MRIGVDVDEIIADTLNALIRFHNEAYGTNLKKSDFFSYECHEVWGGTNEEAIAKWFEFFETEYFVAIEPLAGALPGLMALKEHGHELFAITARQHFIADRTKNWINTHFPDIFSGISFGNRCGIEGVRKTKSAMCAELGITVLIEDDLHHAMDCSQHGIEVLLFDYPWNQRELPAHTYRVFSWDDVIRIVS